MRVGRSSFDDADAGGAGVMAVVVAVGSFIGAGAAVVDVDTEGNMGANWGSGRPAALASAMAASCAIMRW